MIIGTYREGGHTIGERRTGLIDKDLVFHAEMPFVVLREATFEEHVECLREHGYTGPVERNPNAKYYEVSVD